MVRLQPLTAMYPLGMTYFIHVLPCTASSSGSSKVSFRLFSESSTADTVPTYKKNKQLLAALCASSSPTIPHFISHH